MNNPRIERLKTEINLKRAALTEVRETLRKLQDEISGFARLYDRIVGALEAELDGLRQQIEQLERRQHTDPQSSATSSVWGEYGSLEESFDAKYRRRVIHDEPISYAKPKATNEDELRLVYRRLARRFHPDTATDPDEKARLTIIMAQINAAYRARNLDELLALEGQGKSKPAPPQVEPLALEPTYYDWLRIAEQLDGEIALVQSMHKMLLNSPLMALKIEASLARQRGKDLLRDTANRVREEIVAARETLSKLRKS